MKPLSGRQRIDKKEGRAEEIPGGLLPYYNRRIRGQKTREKIFIFFKKRLAFIHCLWYHCLARLRKDMR